MQVRYIGKTPKTDSIAGVGLTWEPEQEREVTPEVGERLICFTDTWVRADDTPSTERKDQSIGLTKPEKPQEEPVPVVDFHRMDKKAMAAYAQRHFNVKLDPKQSEADMRVRITGMQADQHADTEAPVRQ